MEANRVRGEVKLTFPGGSYVLRPEHGRAVRLDDALPSGILGTLIQLTDDRAIKLKTLALVVHHLADGAPKIDEVLVNLTRVNLMTVTSLVVKALSNIAAGSETSGEELAQHDPGTDSTGANA